MVAAKQTSSIELASGNQQNPENYSVPADSRASETRPAKMSCRTAPLTAFVKMSNTFRKSDHPLIRMREATRTNAPAASATESGCPNKAEDLPEHSMAWAATAEELIPWFVLMSQVARRPLADALISAPLPSDATEKLLYGSSADRFHKMDRPRDLELLLIPASLSSQALICSANIPCEVRRHQT